MSDPKISITEIMRPAGMKPIGVPEPTKKKRGPKPGFKRKLKDGMAFTKELDTVQRPDPRPCVWPKTIFVKGIGITVQSWEECDEIIHRYGDNEA